MNEVIDTFVPVMFIFTPICKHFEGSFHPFYNSVCSKSLSKQVSCYATPKTLRRTTLFEILGSIGA